MNTFHLEIMTPDTLLFSGEVESLNVEHPSGNEGYLANHESVLREISSGIVRFRPVRPQEISIKDESIADYFKMESSEGICKLTISGGFISFLNNRAVVFIR